jgi:hypothetical protein
MTSAPAGGRIVIALAAAALVAATAACASHGPSTSTSSARAGTPSGPGHVAFAYMHALFNGQFATARRYVAPTQVSGFDAVATTLSPHSVSSRGLAIGSSDVRGTEASVVITGTICSSFAITALPSVTPSAAPSDSTHCTGNTNPNSLSPIFRVRLMRFADGWRVVFDRDTSAPSTSTGLTGADSATASATTGPS